MYQITMHRFSDGAEMRLPDLLQWRDAMHLGLALCKSHQGWLFYLIKA